MSPTSDPANGFTASLRDWREGDPAAMERVMELAYAELRRMAGHYLRGERPGHTLQPTGLVHEAWIRLAGTARVDWQSKAHFLAVAATLMRRILVDHARARDAGKRGDGVPHLELDAALGVFEQQGVDVLAVHQALDRLAVLDPRQAQLVELKVFGGLEVAEAAEVLGISERTVKREWASAKAWLRGQLSAS